MADAPNVPISKPGEDGRGKFRWAAVYEAVTGASAPGSHHEQKPGVYADSLQAGHEPDKYSAKGIVMVPVLVVLAALFTYGLVTTLFAFLTPGSPNTTGANAVAKTKNERTYNERVADINSSDPNAPVAQPRLEYIRQIEQRPMRNGEPEPPYLRSFKPKDTPANSPEIVPQDLYPDRYVDHVTGKKTLAEYEWASKEKGVASIPVAEAMKLVLGKLPAKKDGAAKPAVGTLDTPKISNGGQTQPTTATPADARPAAHQHKDAPKPEEKKDAPKTPLTPEKKG